MKASNVEVVALAVLTSVSAACATASRTPPVASTFPPAPPMVVVRTDSAAIARARRDSLRLPYTEADVHFMSGMIGHHAQAIRMAYMAPTHGASAAVQRLAARIINAQQDEIVIMQQWLMDRQKPVPQVELPGTSSGAEDHSRHVQHMGLMPGMLTEAQMQQLDAARGKEFDRLFLTLMIQHHRGAVVMVKELLSAPGAAQDEIVFKFSADVNVDQSTEIARMERMLATMNPNRKFS